VAGAAYVAPVLTSSAAAEAEVCAGQKCKPGKKGKKKCKKAGGKTCKCTSGTCQGGGGGDCPCTHNGAQCDLLEVCGGCGNGGCFFGANGANPGVCIDLRSGLCADFSPCSGGSCPSGEVCFTSCCPEPLCANCCAGAGAPASRSVGGAGALYLAG
jgi:hypothetical protein